MATNEDDSSVVFDRFNMSFTTPAEAAQTFKSQLAALLLKERGIDAALLDNDNAKSILDVLQWTAPFGIALRRFSLHVADQAFRSCSELSDQARPPLGLTQLPAVSLFTV